MKRALLCSGDFWVQKMKKTIFERTRYITSRYIYRFTYAEYESYEHESYEHEYSLERKTTRCDAALHLLLFLRCRVLLSLLPTLRSNQNRQRY